MQSNRTSHIPDAELLQAADGELSGRRATDIQIHLESCWTCRARKAEIDKTILEFVRTHETNEEGAPLPPIAPARFRLEAELSQLADRSYPGILARIHQAVFRRHRLAYAGTGIAAIAVCILALHFGTTPVVHADPIPDMRLTPGAIRRVTREDICAAGTTDAIPAIPTTVARRVFEEYGIQNPKPRTFEVDYLITPALGGSEDIQNLWPQPYDAGVWNAHVKDALEDRLRALVCEGKLDLSTAQHDIAVDWIAAYKKYFKTNHPLDIHAGFAIDPPWQ